MDIDFFNDPVDKLLGVGRIAGFYPLYNRPAPSYQHRAIAAAANVDTENERICLNRLKITLYGLLGPIVLDQELFPADRRKALDINPEKVGITPVLLRQARDGFFSHQLAFLGVPSERNPLAAVLCMRLDGKSLGPRWIENVDNEIADIGKRSFQRPINGIGDSR